MDSRFEFELRDSFVLNIDQIKKMHALLSERIGKTEISADCVDDITRNFDSLNGLRDYENVKQKRIVNLRLNSRSEDFCKRASVDFTDKWYFGGTRLKVEARDDVTTRLRSDLLDVISGIRPCPPSRPPCSLPARCC